MFVLFSVFPINKRIKNCQWLVHVYTDYTSSNIPKLLKTQVILILNFYKEAFFYFFNIKITNFSFSKKLENTCYCKVSYDAISVSHQNQ